MTDAGLKELAALRQLKALNLSGTKISAAGVRELRKALPDCAICLEPEAERQPRPAPAHPEGAAPGLDAERPTLLPVVEIRLVRPDGSLKVAGF